ncbi:MAG TPA: hypothetical protein PLV45_14345 [bacterium]|nr:hypothetical protein [bacterium]
MTIEEKIRIAATGDAATLTRLLHEKNRRVIGAMLTNPNLPAKMVVQLVRRNAVDEDQIHMIVAHREWMKEYALKLELILNPRTPRTESLRLMKDIMIRDLAVVSKKVTLHPALREVAINYLRLRLESMRAGEKISLAKTAPIPFLQHLMEDSDLRILAGALINYRLTEEIVLQFISPNHRKSRQLEMVLAEERWSRNPRILKMLARHPGLGYAARQQVFQRVPLPYLMVMANAPQLDTNHRSLAGFVLRRRLLELSLEDQVQMAGTPSRKMLLFLGSVMRAPAVVRAWLHNPRVTVALIDRVMEKNPDPDVRTWLARRSVPDSPEPRDEVSESAADDAPETSGGSASGNTGEERP